MKTRIDESPGPARSTTAAWFALALTAIAALAVTAYFRTCSASKGIATSVQKTAEHVENIVKAVPDIAAKFKTGTITNTFAEEIPQISPSHGDVLELVTTRSEETFNKADSMSLLWKTISLGTTVSEIRVPVTFRYHLRLSDPWRLAARDGVCLVVAPQIRVSQPPAIHTDQMQKSTENGWARFNKSENLDVLERTITPTLERRAADAAHVRLVREACRQSVAEFVKKWLMRENFWRTDRFSSIVVIFPDEHQFLSDQDLQEFEYDPTVRLEGNPQ